MSQDPSPGQVNTVRRFNRFYARRMGLLGGKSLHGAYSLPETRVLFEIAHGGAATARELGDRLELDTPYLSRTLRAFEEGGLIKRKVSDEDRRHLRITMTAAGRATVAEIEKAQSAELEGVLSELSDPERVRLSEAMHSIEAILGERSETPAPFVLRPHQPGDMGWVTWRHGVLYSQMYGWNDRFEALVAQVTADFLRDFDPSRERCWIAEREGEIVGCVFLVAHTERKGVARLRLLLVEPHARGMGIGRRLIQECVRFATSSGYRTVTLWTNSVLDSARHLYEQEGFELVEEEVHDTFGKELVGQTWEIALSKPGRPAPATL